MYRPGSLTFVAFLGILFGAFGLLCCSLQSLGSVGVMLGIPPFAEQAAEQGMDQSGLPGIALLLSELAAVALSAALLAGCIGSLSLRPWARTTMIAYAILTIPNNFCFGISNMMAISDQAMEEIIAQSGGGVPVETARVALLLGSACLGIILNLYAFVVLVVYNTASVKEAFHSGGAPPPPGPWGGPGEYATTQPYPQGYYAPQDPGQQQPPQYPYYPPQQGAPSPHTPPPGQGDYTPPPGTEYYPPPDRDRTPPDSERR